MRASKRHELKVCNSYYRRNHTKHCKLFTSFTKWEQFCKEINKKKRTFALSSMYLNKWNTFAASFFLRLDFFLSYCFSLLSAFLSSSHLSYFEKIRCIVKSLIATSTFFVETKLKKENLKSVSWAPVFGRPNQLRLLDGCG